MSEMGSASSLSRLMQGATQAIYDCQESMKNAEIGSAIKISSEATDQAQLLQKLVETLNDTKMQLTKEIESERVIYIDPTVVSEMEVALELAINDPIDAKVNQIYLSMFGYNSPLWQVLREMQKLLSTVEFLKDPRGKKVAKVQKKNRERRKKRHEKDSISSSETEE